MATAAEEALTWCVYLREWVPVFTSHSDDSRDQCVAEYHRAWEKNIGSDEWKLASVLPGVWRLEVKLPVQKGEFISKVRAAKVAGELSEHAVVVPWGSSQEQELLDYGTRPRPLT